MNYILFDGPVRNQLLPFTYTRPVADIRIGILTIREKWERFLGSTTTTITEDYLSEKYPMVELEENVLINSSFLPNEELAENIRGLQSKQALFWEEEVIAFFTQYAQETVDFEDYETIEYSGEVTRIEYPWDIFSKNGAAIEADLEILTHRRKSQPISSTNQVTSSENIFIEEGAKVEFSILNASSGSIYIGKNAEIMEGSLIRGPFALCEGATVKMGAKIYGPTTIGPYSKAGGEINNSVISAYSNKGHDGFLGNSVLGEWCNLGADTNTSNLKNDYSEVKLWSYDQQKFIPTGLQFCGLMMGDHAKCAINTMFNTGTVVGVNANIFGAGFPRNVIGSFTWGGPAGYKTYLPKKAFEVAREVMKRRNIVLSQVDEDILLHVFEITQNERK
ncbi:MAG: glucose-1-phosphate thymidylyltransferase [Flavobacteriales bacterium CG_4_9_14_3_um_filter_40_17]|nr:MAG: glucose-1-phosphate thymidylyltransferase [Flavobacteriales bacterium CG_4_9_14_3_um_filter_40_17]